jgi:hypothetical protein
MAAWLRSWRWRQSSSRKTRRSRPSRMSIDSSTHMHTYTYMTCNVMYIKTCSMHMLSTCVHMYVCAHTKVHVNNF